MGHSYALARERDSFLTYFFTTLCGLVFSLLILFFMNDSMFFVIFGVVILILALFSLNITIGCLTERPIVLIDDQSISFRANLFTVKEKLQLNDIKHCECEYSLQGNIEVPNLVLYLRNGSKKYIKCNGADDKKVESFAELINDLLRGDNNFNEMFIRKQNSTHSNITQVLKKNNNKKAPSSVNIKDEESSPFGSSGTAFFGWIVLQVIAIVIALIHFNIYSKLVFKGNFMGMFYTVTISIFVLLLLNEFNYQILYGFGWHSTSKGAEIEDYSQGTFNLPIFISNSSEYLERRNTISKRAKNLQIVYVISKIVVGSLIAGGTAQLAFLLNVNNAGRTVVTSVVGIGAIIWVLFLLGYGYLFADIFKLHIIQVENLRPHFDDKEE
ncbi:hypothetical protein [Companilactobacillus insicii]|uniref:hypothetical protein n=1 Tax=Companilactobacillus insicii TaxID=1732567 RepID=UPI000F781FAF|nr:hypothetical protein [Companilactobacillus insicii]